MLTSSTNAKATSKLLTHRCENTDLLRDPCCIEKICCRYLQDVRTPEFDCAVMEWALAASFLSLRDVGSLIQVDKSMYRLFRSGLVRQLVLELDLSFPSHQMCRSHFRLLQHLLLNRPRMIECFGKVRIMFASESAAAVTLALSLLQHVWKPIELEILSEELFDQFANSLRSDSFLEVACIPASVKSLAVRSLRCVLQFESTSIETLRIEDVPQSQIQFQSLSQNPNCLSSHKGLKQLIYVRHSPFRSFGDLESQVIQLAPFLSSLEQIRYRCWLDDESEETLDEFERYPCIKGWHHPTVSYLWQVSPSGDFLECILDHILPAA